MLVSRTFALALAASSLPLAALLAGCDGPSHPPPSLAVTVTATGAPDPNTGLVRGQNAVFTFVVSNPSSSDVPALELNTASTSDGEGNYSLSMTSVACSAQHATCPTFSNAGITAPFTLAAGGTLTLTVTTQVAFDEDAAVVQTMDAYSTQRSGDVQALGHATLADERDGYYELFTTSGLRVNLDIGFKAGATKFATSPATTEHTFVQHQAGYVFPSGLLFQAGDKILVGQADFGHGAETFIGARFFAGTVANLDGVTSTLVGVSTPAGGAATPTVRTVAISGTTLTACVDATPHAIAACPAGSLRQYVLTQEPSGVIFTATDAADNDSFDFQAFLTGDHLLLLQADQTASGNVFAVGLSDAAIPSGENLGIGAVGGTLAQLDLKPGSFSLSPVDIDTKVLSPGISASLAPVAGGPTGLMAGVRPSDGAPLLMLAQPGLVLISGPAGELDALLTQGAN